MDFIEVWGISASGMAGSRCSDTVASSLFLSPSCFFLCWLQLARMATNLAAHLLLRKEVIFSIIPGKGPESTLIDPFGPHVHL